MSRKSLGLAARCFFLVRREIAGDGFGREEHEIVGRKKRLFCVEWEDEEKMRGGLFIGRACWLDGVASDSELRGRDAVVERL